MYQKIAEIEKSSQKAALCIVVETKGSTPRKNASKMIVFADGTISGTIGGGAIEKRIINDAIDVINKHEAQLFSYQLEDDLNMACGGSMQVYIEPILQQQKLIIFGAGHIGKILAKLALELDFSVTVIDERADIFQTWTSQSCFTIINSSYDKVLETLVFDEDTYIVVVTHSHELDKKITRFCAAQKSAYIGMIASRKKSVEIKNAYIVEKSLSEEQILRIDSPIGVPIKCETPAEIAVSVLAKIIDIKNTKKIIN